MDINTLAELKEFEKSDDGKAIIASYVEESGYKTADDVAGLVSKKDELLGKLKRAQEDKTATSEVFKKYDIIDSEDLAGKLATLASAKSNETDLEKMARRLEIIEKTAEEDKRRADTEKALRVGSEKKSRIMSALKNAHVNDESFDVLFPYFDKMVSTEESDGKINLVVNSDDGAKPFDSFVDEWTKSDKAKQFIKAPANSGGGASGPGGSSNQGNMTLEQIAKLPSRAERTKAMDQLAAASNN